MGFDWGKLFIFDKERTVQELMSWQGFYLVMGSQGIEQLEGGCLLTSYLQCDSVSFIMMP